MERDLSYFPPARSGLIKALQNEEQTLDYCNDMGGRPGVFWAQLLLDGRSDDDFVNNARRMGRALQITNILRDIADDVADGRCYLPLTDLTAQDLLPQDLADKKNYGKLRPVIFKWIAYGVENISASPDFIVGIPRRYFGSRASAAWPALWCLDTLYLLATAGNLLDKKRRISIPRRMIYLTILLSPLYCCSNFIFRRIVNYKAMKIKNLTPQS
jgi:farnesyl-diphosphate farnesyltransferase